MRLHRNQLLVIGAIAAILLGTGCTEVVSNVEMHHRYNEHLAGTTNSIYYMGSKNGYHYLRHFYTFGSSTYRIHESEFPVNEAMPLTDNKSEWIRLTEELVLASDVLREPLRMSDLKIKLRLPTSKQTSHNQSLERTAIAAVRPTSS